MSSTDTDFRDSERNCRTRTSLRSVSANIGSRSASIELNSIGGGLLAVLSRAGGRVLNTLNQPTDRQPARQTDRMRTSAADTAKWWKTVHIIISIPWKLNRMNCRAWPCFHDRTWMIPAIHVELLYYYVWRKVLSTSIARYEFQAKIQNHSTLWHKNANETGKIC